MNMNCLLKNVKIIEPGHKLHHKVRDIWIKDGLIFKIATSIDTPRNVKIFNQPDSCISPGWVDVGCYTGEPGFEERETLLNINEAASSGGYTAICCMPNTKPALHSKSEIHFIQSRSKDLNIDIHPIGAISKNTQSLEMAEILQMHEAGAVAFSDGGSGIQKTGLLLRSLEYIKNIPESIILNSSYEQELGGSGQMHEGESSTYLGLKGIPSLAEITAVLRDLEILKYSESRLMIHKISTSEAVNLLRSAKKKQSGLFSSVSIFNLVFEDSDLISFSQNLKLMPPIRSRKDRLDLIKGLQDSTIDIIVSDHSPMNPEKKDLEFQAAAFGAISLETSFALSQTFISDEINPDLWVEKASINPRKIFNLTDASIKVGNIANITWFNPTKSWNYSLENIKSVSKNSPCISKTLRGKVLGTFYKKIYIN